MEFYHSIVRLLFDGRYCMLWSLIGMTTWNGDLRDSVAMKLSWCSFFLLYTYCLGVWCLVGWCVLPLLGWSLGNRHTCFCVHSVFQFVRGSYIWKFPIAYVGLSLSLTLFICCLHSLLVHDYNGVKELNCEKHCSVVCLVRVLCSRKLCQMSWVSDWRRSISVCEGYWRCWVVMAVRL